MYHPFRFRLVAILIELFSSVSFTIIQGKRDQEAVHKDIIFARDVF